ncbi:hypothetical protein, partial [Exiguobacterium indicum]|uniref:hypothetical protein n=1 Tax=Exiguobacterium indicum TaxID=296995 RepID=UPI002B262F65
NEIEKVKVNETVNVSSNSNSNSKGSEGKREGSDGNLPTPCGNREGYDFVPNNKELAFYDRKEEMEFKANLLKVQSEIGRELNYNEKLVLLD